jgi:hypothetical protein
MNASGRVGAALVLVLSLAAAISSAGASVPRSDPLGGSGQQSIAAVTKFGAGYLAVGTDQPAGQSYANPVVWTARRDGTHWTRTGHLKSSARALPRLHGIVSSPDGVQVAVGSITDDSEPDKPPCCDGGPGFFISTDGGRNFNPATDVQTVRQPDGSQYGLVEVNAIAAGTDGTLVGVGEASGAPDTAEWFLRPLTWISTDDGQSWQVLDLPMDSGAGGLAAGITVDSQGFLAVGTEYPNQNADAGEPVMWRSTDGTNWTATTVPANGGATGIASSDAGIVVVGTTEKTVDGVSQNCGGTMWFSNDDGSTWTHTDRDPNLLLLSVGLAQDGTFIAVGSTCWDTGPTRRPIGYSSANGQDWQILKTAKSSKAGEMLGVAPFGKTGQLIVGDLGGHGFYWTGS